MEFLFKNGKSIQTIYDIDEACEKFTENIKTLFEKEKKRNAYLVEENDKLKDEHYKDNKIQELEKKIKKFEETERYSFLIDKETHEKIYNWQIKHMAEKHKLTTAAQRIQAGGAIGGTWSYVFIPTSIGVVGKCVCGKCEEEFIFEDL